MEIKTNTKDGVTIIEVSGKLDSIAAPEAQERIMPLVVSKCCLVLDLGKCSYISSSGLRVLLMIAKQLSTQEGRWALAGVCDEIKDVMDMTGFSTHFKTCDTVDEAIKLIQEEV